jgi:hypothetical protein
MDRGEAARIWHVHLFSRRAIGPCGFIHMRCGQRPCGKRRGWEREPRHVRAFSRQNYASSVIHQTSLRHKLSLRKRKASYSTIQLGEGGKWLFRPDGDCFDLSRDKLPALFGDCISFFFCVVAVVCRHTWRWHLAGGQAPAISMRAHNQASLKVVMNDRPATEH